MGLAFSLRAGLIALLFAAGGSVALAEDHDNDPGSGGDGVREAAYATVRVGGESRQALAVSNRQLLTLSPSQVAAGGRVFTFGKIPADLGEEAFTAEFLVWDGTRWSRRAVIPRQARQVGHVSSTVVVPDLESGSVPTAVFARRQSGEPDSVITGVMTVPDTSIMHVGFSLDEWDWSELGPVGVRVYAELAPGQRNAGKRYELFSRRIAVGAGESPHWFNETIDLGVLGGRSVRFVFTSIPERVEGRLAPYVVWSVPQIVSARAPVNGRGIVLITLDGLNAGSLSCCGAARKVSPFMESLFSEQGVIFEHAVTQAVDTVPSTLTLMTGLYPSVHQVLSPKRTLGEEVETIAQVLESAGYATAAFTDGVALSPEVGLGRGFSTYVQSLDQPLWDIEGRAGPTFDRALEWIERNAARPYFVWIQTRQARSPHVPPRGYETMFRDSVAADDASESIKGLAGLRARRDREIRYLDDQLERFVTRLDALSSPERTLVVVTSAHGEEMLEHGALGNGTQLYEESIRVPLMMRGAGIAPRQRIAQTIGLIDVAPTILAVSEVRVPDEMQGGSVAESLLTATPFSLPPRYSEAHGTRRELAAGETESWSPPAFAVIDGGRKVILTPGADGGPVREAYDIEADPSESTDLLVLRSDEAANDLDRDASASPDGAVAGAPPAWVSELSELVETYPALCRQLARERGEAPGLPAEARVRLDAFGYID